MRIPFRVEAARALEPWKPKPHNSVPLPGSPLSIVSSPTNIYVVIATPVAFTCQYLKTKSARLPNPRASGAPTLLTMDAKSTRHARHSAGSSSAFGLQRHHGRWLGGRSDPDCCAFVRRSTTVSRQRWFTKPNRARSHDRQLSRFSPNLPNRPLSSLWLTIWANVAFFVDVIGSMKGRTPFGVPTSSDPFIRSRPVHWSGFATRLDDRLHQLAQG